MVLFKKFFEKSRSIYEFGCGTGLNLVAAGEMYPDKNLFGLDWSASSCAIIDQLRKIKQLNIQGRLFDMYEPDNSVQIGKEDAVLTVGALEQLGSGFKPFLEFLLSKKPHVCLHMETMNELYTRKTAADFITLQYTRQRRYLTGFLDALRENEKQGKIRILQVQRTFGGQYHEGYSFVVWQPVSR
jgi:cyclopropane fatty-acyl-phospholipid synthase-like methyltransferase